MPKQNNLENIPTEEISRLHNHQEFNDGIFLLNQDLILKTPEGVKKAKIVEIEPFSCMEKPSHKKAYESKNRKRGEIFIIWFRGTIPFLNIVVNSKKGSVVSIKKVLLDGKIVSGLTLVNTLGMARKNIEKPGPEGTKEWRQYVENMIDGAQIHNDNSLISIENAEENDLVIELRRANNSRANNSLGVFANITHFNKSIKDTYSN